MTTNLASSIIQRYCQAHPGPLSEEQLEELNKLLLDELMKSFPPEFLNRLDGIIPFLPLSKEACFIITEGLLKDFAEQAYREKKLEVIITPELIEYCAEKGFDPKFGAKTLKALDKIACANRNCQSPATANHQRGRFSHLNHQRGQACFVKKQSRDEGISETG